MKPRPRPQKEFFVSKFPDSDPRFDPINLAALIDGMLFDADRIANACETLAHKNRADSDLHAFMRRMGTGCRDFHSHLLQILPTMPASLREAIERK